MFKSNIRFVCYSISALFALPLCGAHADNDGPGGSAAADVKALTGVHTRMVWMRDGESTPHPWGGGPKMRLMVLDTEDGKGIHPLFPDVAGYSWPYLTPDGKGIVFNFLKNPDSPTKGQCVMYVNWDGSGLREVLPPDRTDGLVTWCSCITQDPATSYIWVYCDMFEANGATAPADRKFKGSRRFRLDKPSIEKPVYDHYLGRMTAAPDGKVIAGVYEHEGGAPTGVYDIPSATWHPIAQGCQPYLLPSTDPYIYWVCDGGHRGGRMFTNPTIPGKTIYRHFDLRNTPGMGKYEVRYPHWSNDVHFMAVDSPMPDSDKQYQKTEICFCRFDEGLTKIEKWVQVTNNNVGDYFASTWVDTKALPAAASASATPAVGTTTNTNATPAPVSTPAVNRVAANAWPGNKAGLVYLWENSSAGNEIVDAAGKHSLCIPDARDGAIFGRYGVMDVAGGSFCARAGSTAAVLEGCEKSNAFTIEATIHPERLDMAQPGSILSFSDGGAVSNVTLEMAANNLQLRLHTSLNSADTVISIGSIKTGGPQHVAVTFDGKFVTSYLNGRTAALNGSVQGDLSVWASAPLVFGDGYTGGHNWPGSLEAIAIYSRALTAQEVAAHYMAGNALMANRHAAPRVEITAKLRDITPNSTPEAILPYHRLLVVDDYDVVSVDKGTCDAKVISVAQWGILGDRVLALDREKGKTYHLVLESMSDNPQLESECTHNDSTDVTLPLYYDVDKHLDKLPPKAAK